MRFIGVARAAGVTAGEIGGGVGSIKKTATDTTAAMAGPTTATTGAMSTAAMAPIAGTPRSKITPQVPRTEASGNAL